MRIVIEEVISRINATSAEAALSPEKIGVVVQAVMEAIEVRDSRSQDMAEELSLDNYQQRVRPGRP